MFLYLITILCVLIIIYLLYKHSNYRENEHYTDNPLLILRVLRSPHNIYIENTQGHNISSIDSIDHIITKRSELKELCTDCIASIKTFFDILYADELSKLICVLPTEQTCVFIKQRNTKIYENVQDVFREKKTIGYIQPFHKTLLQYIATSFGITDISVRQVQNPIITGDIYCLFLIQEIEFKKIDIGLLDIDVLECEGADMNILRSLIPYIKLKNKDFSKFVENYRDRYSIKTCFTFDNLVVGNDSFDEQKYGHIINDIHTKLNDSASMNFYSMFTSTIQYLKPNTIEHFIDTVYYEPTENIKGYYLSPLYLTVKTQNIGIPLTKGDIINLRYQERSEENGSYKVQHTLNDEILLERVSNLNIIRELRDKKATSYVCIGDPSKTTQEMCETDPKNIWDKPCERNEECPFYQKNKNYNNYRGGCIDGTCELPLGVQSKGFRYYNIATRPICYNCPPDDIYCCSKQTYPDYVFPMDTFERIIEIGADKWFNKPYIK